MENARTFISQANPLASYLSLKKEVDAAVYRVLDSGWYILGREVENFEQEFSAYIGVSFGVGVASGTDALAISLRALGVGAGDAVFTVSHTAGATVAAIELVGAVPVLVEIDPASFTLSPERLEEAVKACKKTANFCRPKAVIPVHLYGHPADMKEIDSVARQYDLLVLEDCAQAHGAEMERRRVGQWGDLAAFSFYPTKNLAAMGDGGMVLTNDKRHYEKLLALRQYGWQERYVSSFPGMNSRLDEIQAAILRTKLVYLAMDNSRRRTIAASYDRVLEEGPPIKPHIKENILHAFHQYVIRTPQRDNCIRFFKERGIGTAVHYPVPVHLQPAYKGRILLGNGFLEVTEKVCKEIISLPMFPQLTESEIDRVCEALQSWREYLGKVN